MAEEGLPDNPAENSEDNHQNGDGERHHRRRRRVRKRIRIKKKSSPKKKLRKIGEKVLWAIIIIGFIATLVIMVRQLNIVDEKNKKAKSSSLDSFSLTEFERS